MFLNHFCLRKAHTKRSSATFRDGSRGGEGAIQHRRPRRRKYQPVSECVNQRLCLSASVNAAAEGDLNMHSSKGFYTPILVCEESHPVTAL